VPRVKEEERKAIQEEQSEWDKKLNSLPMTMITTTT